MILSLGKFKHHLRQLNSAQKVKILKYAIIMNLFLMTILLVLGLKIHAMKTYQTAFINKRIDFYQPTAAEQEKIKSKVPVYAKVYLIYLNDLNIKDKFLTVWYGLSIAYNAKDFSGRQPQIDLGNGIIRNKGTVSRLVEHGIVHEMMTFEADIEPHYVVQLYPLDEQIISLKLVPDDCLECNYYIKVTNFLDYTATSQSDYLITKQGYINQVESIAIDMGNKEHNLFNLVGRSYIVFNHKNIYSYIKNIQYIILSLSIAIFGLLINSRQNSPNNGRIAVIGSAIFSLAANIFQINSSMKQTNALTLIDLITLFTGLIILLSFLITIRTLSFLDEEGYETAKVFDLSMFWCLLSYTVVFFILIYIYA